MRIQSVKESTDELGRWNMRTHTHARTHTYIYKLTKGLDSMDKIHKISKSDLICDFLSRHALTDVWSLQQTHLHTFIGQHVIAVILLQ